MLLQLGVLLFLVNLHCLKYLFTLNDKFDSNIKTTVSKFLIQINNDKEKNRHIELTTSSLGLSQSRLIYEDKNVRNYAVIDVNSPLIAVVTVNNEEKKTGIQLPVNNHRTQDFLNLDLNIFKCYHPIELAFTVLEKFENCLPLYLLSETNERPNQIYKALFQNLDRVNAERENIYKFHDGWIDFDFHPTMYAYHNAASSFYFNHLSLQTPSYSGPGIVSQIISLSSLQQENLETISDSKISWHDETMEAELAEAEEERTHNYFELLYYNTNRNCDKEWVYLEVIFKNCVQSESYVGHYKSPLFLSKCYSHNFKGSFWMRSNLMNDHHVKIYLNVIKDFISTPYRAEKIDLVFADVNKEEPNNEIEGCAGHYCVRYLFYETEIVPSAISEPKRVTLNIVSLMTLNTPWKVCTLVKGSPTCKYTEASLNSQTVITIQDDNDLILIQSNRQVTVFTIKDHNKVFEVDDKLRDQSEISTSCMIYFKVENIEKDKSNITSDPSILTTVKSTTKSNDKDTTKASSERPAIVPSSTSTKKVTEKIILKTPITTSHNDVKDDDDDEKEIYDDDDTEDDEENYEDDYEDNLDDDFDDENNPVSTLIATTQTNKDYIKKSSSENKISISSSTTLDPNLSISHENTQKTDKKSASMETISEVSSPAYNRINDESDEYCKRVAKERYPNVFIMFPISIVFFISTLIALVFVIKKYKHEVYNFIGIKPAEYIVYQGNIT